MRSGNIYRSWGAEAVTDLGEQKQLQILNPQDFIIRVTDRGGGIPHDQASEAIWRKHLESLYPRSSLDW